MKIAEVEKLTARLVSQAGGTTLESGKTIILHNRTDRSFSFTTMCSMLHQRCTSQATMG